jgi:hypothetical protein
VKQIIDKLYEPGGAISKTAEESFYNPDPEAMVIE